MNPADCTPGTLYYTIHRHELRTVRLVGEVERTKGTNRGWAFFSEDRGPELILLWPTDRLATNASEVYELEIQYHHQRIETYTRLLRAQTEIEP